MSADDDKIHKEFLKYLQNKSFNRKCADCDTPNPSWASVTLGLFLCQACAGQHRGLGCNKSLIKSTLINTWEVEELRRMYCGGNKVMNIHAPNKTFAEKYKNCDSFKKKLDKLCKENEVIESGTTFIDNMHKKEVLNSSAKIKNKKIVKLSEQFSNTSSKSEEPKETYKLPEVKIDAQPPIMKYYNAEEEKTTQISGKHLDTKELKKTISNKRSPFTFTGNSSSSSDCEDDGY